jgi:HAE1 family hydrophobic/amphiphilic exporter-1
MSPIAFGASAGSEWKSGLAWALIGGLTSSLLLTLVLVPVVYSKFDEWSSTLPAFVGKLLAKPVRNPGAAAESIGALEPTSGD